MSFARFCTIFSLLAVLSGCGDNLIPSGDDERPAAQGGIGSAVGQAAPSFGVGDTSGNAVTLASALASRKGIVLYFTMWCPSCDEQAVQLQSMMTSFPEVGFYLVDYVSGSVTDAGAAALANGFSGVGFVTLADTAHALQNAFQGTMETTVVIDSSGTIRMNEAFRDGTRLKAFLAELK